MGYTEDLRSLERTGKMRMVAMIVAIASVALAAALEQPLFHWVRFLAWVAAGAFAWREAVFVKRLGRDPDFYYLRAVFFVVIAVVNLYFAVTD
ncbi:MAG: hypothetical protein HOO96_42055 [Polyangiaceae bacterium]|nr:hypothetical protein [Polyangiaceae bacterium]